MTQHLRKAAILGVFAPLSILWSLSTVTVPTNERYDAPAPGVQPVLVPVPSGPLPDVGSVRVKKTFWLTVTAYSSTVDQTDSDPFTTANGTRVRDGVIAHNFLPFGTKVRFPDRFGDKVFIVTDRLHPSKGQYIADLWMETREQAKQWGAPILKMEILETPRLVRR